MGCDVGATIWGLYESTTKFCKENAECSSFPLRAGTGCNSVECGSWRMLWTAPVTPRLNPGRHSGTPLWRTRNGNGSHHFAQPAQLNFHSSSCSFINTLATQPKYLHTNLDNCDNPISATIFAMSGTRVTKKSIFTFNRDGRTDSVWIPCYVVYISVVILFKLWPLETFRMLAKELDILNQPWTVCKAFSIETEDCAAVLDLQSQEKDRS